MKEIAKKVKYVNVAATIFYADNVWPCYWSSAALRHLPSAWIPPLQSFLGSHTVQLHILYQRGHWYELTPEKINYNSKNFKFLKQNWIFHGWRGVLSTASISNNVYQWQPAFTSALVILNSMLGPNHPSNQSIRLKFKIYTWMTSAILLWSHILTFWCHNAKVIVN